MENKKRNIKRLGMILLITAVVSLLLIGSAFAKYVTTMKQRAEMLSSDFHFSAEYLEEGTTPVFSVTDMSTLGFEIYNYEKTNTALVSGTEISFRIDTNPACGIKIKNDKNEELTSSDDVFTIPRESTGKIWKAEITTGSSDNVQVSIKTISPYSLTLSARFQSDYEKPSFSIVDKGNYRVLTFKSNSYSGPVQVKWDQNEISPDNTNPLMATWLDENEEGTFTAEINHTYELIFVENKIIEKKEQNGQSHEIIIE